MSDSVCRHARRRQPLRRSFDLGPYLLSRYRADVHCTLPDCHWRLPAHSTSREGCRARGSARPRDKERRPSTGTATTAYRRWRHIGTPLVEGHPLGIRENGFRLPTHGRYVYEVAGTARTRGQCRVPPAIAIATTATSSGATWSSRALSGVRSGAALTSYHQDERAYDEHAQPGSCRRV